MKFGPLLRFVATHPEHGRVHLIVHSLCIDELVHPPSAEEFKVYRELPGHLDEVVVRHKDLTGINFMGVTNELPNIEP